MIKAIETRYADCRFRSRTEARWAVFLDAMGIAWEYEKEGYELPSGRYLPDFWLPELKAWLEVKGSSPTRDERTKAGELRAATGFAVMLTTGAPSTDLFRAMLRLGQFDKKAGARIRQDLQTAVSRAKSARFEFSDSSSPRQERIAGRPTRPLDVFAHAAGAGFVVGYVEASGDGAGVLADLHFNLDDACTYAAWLALISGFNHVNYVADAGIA